MEKPVFKFGDIKAADFGPKLYGVDSNAFAVVLADVGSSEYEGNSSGSLSINYTRHRRVRILNKNGFDAGSVTIRLQNGDHSEEELQNLEAFTYNYENGQVVKTKVDKNSIYKTKVDDYHTEKKFSFPSLREGSIIEYRYKIVSPYYTDLPYWHFQGDYPVLWSEYHTSVPSNFDYVTYPQNLSEFDYRDSKSHSEILLVNWLGRTETINATMLENWWGLKNVPALRTEPFTSSIDNHLKLIDFQLRAINYENGKRVEIMSTWEKFAEVLLKSERFGDAISSNNGFLSDDIKLITSGAMNDEEKALKLFSYVRDNYTCDDHYAVLMTNSLKKTFSTKKGSVAEINLLLVAMLRNAKLHADPVLLSQRKYGKAYLYYPLVSKFNYVVCQVKLGDKLLLLDASEPRLGFGKLPEQAYNGYARLIDKVPSVIDLSADSLKEAKVTSVFLSNNDNGKGLSGTFSSTLGYYESCELRDKLVKTSVEDYMAGIKKKYPSEINIKNMMLDSLKRYEEPVTESYEIAFEPNEDILYLSPMMAEAMKENPFKNADRKYPVEMPYTMDDVYILNMEVPKNYKVDELPQSVKVKLNEGQGEFEYMVALEGNNIQLRSRIKLNKANFTNEDYSQLREFFGYIVKKHSETIVFKKM